jgi:hypothetical protein
MIIVNDITPTSELSALKIGDSISNGIGTFGEIADIKFEDTDEYWLFTFTLVGGGYITAKKIKNIC